LWQSWPNVYFSEISISPPPAPRLLFLMSIVYDRLPEVLLTSNPRSVLQYVISVLQQLNIESSAAQLDDSINSIEHQFNRTLLRENLLRVLNSSVHLNSLPSVQQMAFALHLLTVSTFYFETSVLPGLLHDHSFKTTSSNGRFLHN